MMYAPSTAPAIVGAISSAVSRRPSPDSSRRYAHADASDPGAMATALVAFAIGDGSPHAIATGNDSNVPPPATALTAPASADAPSSRPSRAGSTAPSYERASVRAANDFERPGQAVGLALVVGVAVRDAAGDGVRGHRGDLHAAGVGPGPLEVADVAQDLNQARRIRPDLERRDRDQRVRAVGRIGRVHRGAVERPVADRDQVVG